MEIASISGFSAASYQKNCGNGTFIDAAVLLANIVAHEAGPTLGHYQQYSSAQADPANNVGVAAESFVRGPAVTSAEFEAALQAQLDGKTVPIRTATISEAACNSDVRYDTACTFRGAINYSPYQACP